MSNARTIAALSVVWLMMSGLVRAETLGIGSAAPALNVTDWVKGEAIDIAAGKGKTIYVVEFWATWCPSCVASIPHLTNIQKELGPKGVQVIGVTPGREDNTLDKVKNFVEAWGDKMGYAVAFDGKRDVAKAYMEASEQQGIPTAFVIDKSGRIAWIGFPDRMLDATINEMLAGTFDIGLAMRVAEIDKSLEAARWDGDWKKVLAGLDRIIALKPNSPDRVMEQFFIYANYLDDTEKAKRAAERAFDMMRGDADYTAGLAMQIISEDAADGYNAVAEAALERSLVKNPDHAGLRIARFRSLAAAGKDGEAVKFAAETIDIFKGQANDLSEFAGVLSSPPRAKLCGDLALRAAQLAIEADPEEPRHYLGQFYILWECKKDRDAAARAGQYLVQKAAGNADFLNGFAWELLTGANTKGKFNALALAAAEAMHKSPGGDSWTHLDTLALAKFENGAVEDAIALETKAISLCDNEFAKITLQGSLKRFVKGE